MITPLIVTTLITHSFNANDFYYWVLGGSFTGFILGGLLTQSAGSFSVELPLDDKEEFVSKLNSYFPKSNYDLWNLTDKYASYRYKRFSWLVPTAIYVKFQETRAMMRALRKLVERACKQI